MDVYIKEGRVYGLLKNRKILKLTLDNQIHCKKMKKHLQSTCRCVNIIIGHCLAVDR